MPHQCDSTPVHLWAVVRIRAGADSVSYLHLQLDCPSVTNWDIVITFAVGGPISNPRPVLDSSAQITWSMILDFCCKITKRARLSNRREKLFSRVF